MGRVGVDVAGDVAQPAAGADAVSAEAAGAEPLLEPLGPMAAAEAPREDAELEGLVGSAHCFGGLRQLPIPVFGAALQAMRASKRCDGLDDVGSARARGLLVRRGLVAPAARETSLKYLAALVANLSVASEEAKTRQVKRYAAAIPSALPFGAVLGIPALCDGNSYLWTAGTFVRYHGRLNYRGDQMNSPRDIHAVNPELLDALDAQLREWAARGVLLPLPYRRPPGAPLTAAAPRPAPPDSIREIEHVVLDPAQHDCPQNHSSLTPCGCDWHVDGGMRGYKVWSVLEKRGGGALRNHTSLVAVTSSNAALMCKLTAQLEASVSAGELLEPTDAEDLRMLEEAAAQRAGEHAGERGPLWHLTTDSDGSKAGWQQQDPAEVYARVRDKLALEASSCVLELEPGDGALLFPGTFHRTQDLEQYRVALIAEA